MRQRRLITAVPSPVTAAALVFGRGVTGAATLRGFGNRPRNMPASATQGAYVMYNQPTPAVTNQRRTVRIPTMLEVRDAADAILLGLFLFGLLLSAATLLLGVADLGMHHGQADDGGLLPTSLGALLVFLSWLGGAGFVLRRAAD